MGTKEPQPAPPRRPDRPVACSYPTGDCVVDQNLDPQTVTKWLMSQPLTTVLKVQEGLAKAGINMTLETSAVELVDPEWGMGPVA